MNMDEYLAVLSSDPTLEHHGILGMKWGVRRYQNKDGSLTNAGKARRNGDSGVNAKTAAKVAAGTAAAAAIAYTAYKNPGNIDQKLVAVGKKATMKALASIKDGVEEGLNDAPKKAAKAIVTGIIMNQAKKALDSAVGKEESAKIFQANDAKKIGKFWKVNEQDSDDDDDDKRRRS